MPEAAAVGQGTTASRGFVRWRVLAAATILTVMFIPARRYTLPASLPFALEPYRVVIAFVLLAWLSSLLVDPRVRLRSLGFDWPFLAFVVAIFGSMLANTHRVSAVSPVLSKSLPFFLSFFVVVYFIASTTERFEDKLFLVKAIVVGGAILAALSIFESRTHRNLFDDLPRILPFLQKHEAVVVGASTDGRGASHRAIASAQSPIELGAILVMIVPLAIAIAAESRKKRWWFAVALLLPGAISSVSRTVITMLVAVLVVFICVRPRAVKRMWPAVLPLIAVVHVALPGTLGTLGNAFFPKGGLVAQQSNTAVGSGRLATLGPALRTEFDPNPILGEGFGTRITTPDDPRVPPNAPILDDQWLGVLLETGLVGTTALVIFFWVAIRRLGRVARHDATQRGWLCAGLGGSLSAFAIGMFTFDAFSFIEVTLLFFTLTGIAAAVLAPEVAKARSTSRVRGATDRIPSLAHAVPRQPRP